MPDIYVPGVKSRFDTEKIITGLMDAERIPRNRVEKLNEGLVQEKQYWQELGRRITDVREVARMLYSYQNPFNERAAASGNDTVLSAVSTREAVQQEHNFVVKQLAKADKFLSNPLDKNYKVPAGTYTFSTGAHEVSFKFNGGSLSDFTGTINRRGLDKIKAGLIAVQPGTSSMVIESLETGIENKLEFLDDAKIFAVQIGILEQSASTGGTPEVINIRPVASDNENLQTGGGATFVQAAVSGDSLVVPPMSKTNIPINRSGSSSGIKPTPTMILKFETSITKGIGAAAASSNENTNINNQTALTQGADIAPNGVINTPIPALPQDDENAVIVDGRYALQKQRQILADGQAGTDDNSINGETPETGDTEAQNIASNENPPDAVKPQDYPVNLGILSVLFDDGTKADLQPIADTENFSQNQYQLAALAAGKTVRAITINNDNMMRKISIRNIQILDPLSTNGQQAAKPLHQISQAQDAVIEMDGIEVTRPSNNIDDLVPGLNLIARSVSQEPVGISVQTDTEAVKDSVIRMVGNYNRLMAELNVLTRSDENVIRELDYLSPEEQDALKKKLGIFSGDAVLSRFRSSLVQIMTAPYTTADGESLMLQAFGISTDARRSGSYDPAKLRGYLEIDEKVLDEALQTRMTALQQIFGRDSDGDLIIDTGLAYSLDNAVRPYVELGGIVAGKTNTIDSRISANTKRIETMDRQLANKEQTLRTQYGQLEGAYNRMERMSNSLDSFSQQNKQ